MAHDSANRNKPTKTIKHCGYGEFYLKNIKRVNYIGGGLLVSLPPILEVWRNWETQRWRAKMIHKMKP